MNHKKIFSVGLVSALVIFVVFGFIFSASAADPSGADTTPGTPETSSAGTPGNTTAEGGNITQVDLSGNSQSTHWQGFWGQVSGAIALQDASGDVMYNWSIGTMSGNVYISNASSFTWSCARVDEDWCDTITGTGDDSCSNTFKDTTKTFTVAGTGINNVNTTQTYNYSGSGTFDEGIINCSDEMVFVAEIYNNKNTFNNNAADFQAIVPVNGTVTRVYYFWIELGV